MCSFSKTALIPYSKPILREIYNDSPNWSVHEVEGKGIEKTAKAIEVCPHFLLHSLFALFTLPYIFLYLSLGLWGNCDDYAYWVWSKNKSVLRDLWYYHNNKEIVLRCIEAYAKGTIRNNLVWILSVRAFKLLFSLQNIPIENTSIGTINIPLYNVLLILHIATAYFLFPKFSSNYF